MAFTVHDYDKPITRRPMLGQMRLKHIFIIGFVYAFGYFVPTLLLIQEKGAQEFFMQDMFISNLAYDMIFTVMFSVCLLNRRMLKAMRIRLILPLILCLLAIYVSEHLDLVDKSIAVDTSGRKQYRLKERYMYLMSRFCFCFVNVGSKLFLFKEAAF